MNHKVTLLRHGLSVGNEQGIIQGQMDYPLSDAGVEQTNALLHFWLDHNIRFDTVIASPLLRAKQTAEILSSGLEIPLELDQVWCERHQGKAEGRLYSDVKKEYANYSHDSPYDPLFETGESRWDLFTRAATAMQCLLRRPAGAYLVVSHGAMLDATIRTTLGIPPSPGRTRSVRIVFDNTGYALLEYNAEDARWLLQHLNITCHLS